jgi:hypothetical protein
MKPYRRTPLGEHDNALVSVTAPPIQHVASSRIARWQSGFGTRKPIANVPFIALTIIALAGCDSSHARAVHVRPGSKAHMLNDVAHLAIIESHGAIVVEEGSAIGTINALLTLQFDRITANGSFTAIAPNGSFSGTIHITQFATQNNAAGSTYEYAGTASLGHGTGDFTHITADTLHVHALYEPSTSSAQQDLTLTVNGPLYY